jgi:hypothetical protein
MAFGYLQVHGHTVMPGCALLELAGAMGRIVADDSAPGQISVTGVSFSTAIISTYGGVLHSDLHRHSGSVTVTSHASLAANAELAVHLSGQVSAIQESHSPAGCQLGRSRHRGILAALELRFLEIDLGKAEARGAACTADVAHNPLAQDSAGFWMHPAAAEAAAALRAFVHRTLPAGCRRCMRTAACGAYLTGSRRAATRKLLAVAAGQHRPRRNRASRHVTSLSLQSNDSAMAAHMGDVTSVLTEPSPAADSANYTTVWQRVAEPPIMSFDRYSPHTLVD